jgi:SAM-dependent methyltransferase
LTEKATVTRGRGLLERFLAQRRVAMADRLIDPALREGRLLDYGCGSFPLFLSRTRFREKVGVDQLVDEGAPPPGFPPGIPLHRFDIEVTSRLPFPDAHFQVVTMLAVFEHVPVDELVVLLDEVERVLAPGGQFIMTTPAGWTGPILGALARLGLISAEEEDEHEGVYSHGRIGAILDRSRLGRHPRRRGSFELGMNNWVVVTRGRDDRGMV